MPPKNQVEEFFEDSSGLLAAAELLDQLENQIHEGCTLYLITWSPDPKKLLSKYDMIKNHKWYHKTVFPTMRKAMRLLCLLPEFNLNGNIHYHGFFQLSDPVKWYKSVLPMIKRQGFVKISEAKQYKLGEYSAEGNSLHYYKKEFLQNINTFGTDYVVSHTEGQSHAEEDRKAKRLKARATIESMFAAIDTEDTEQEEDAIAILLRIK